MSGPTLGAFTNIRGATFTTPGGTAFLQTPLTDPVLTGIDPTYPTTFNFFSPIWIFTPGKGSNITDVTFSIPGTNGAATATVGAFGAIFTDVDLANTTRLEFFYPSNNPIFNKTCCWDPSPTAASRSSGRSPRPASR